MNTVYTRLGLIVRSYIGNNESGWLLLDYNSRKCIKTYPNDLECFEDVYGDSIKYHRPPTKAEISFGHGATHYREFHPMDCTNKNGKLKQWLKSADDGLRYYR